MRGELSSGRHSKRHPLDWYVDEIWCARQLYRALGGFQGERASDLEIWDPAAGTGNTVQAFWEEGFRCRLSDVVQNVDWSQFDMSEWPDGWQGIRPNFFSADFLEVEAAPAPCTIVCNPPYSYRKVQGISILELFVRQALKLATGRVCMLVPNKWLASQVRYRLFMHDAPPVMVLHLTQRPSMPPGDRIQLMGNRAFRGGMIDYCWIVWDVQNPTAPGQTRTAWLPPLHIIGGAV